MVEKIFGITITLVLAAAFALPASEEISLTLDEAVSLALRDNLDLRLRSEELNKARAAISEARSGLLPALTLGATTSDTRGYFSKDLSSHSGQASARQIIYSGGKIVSVVKISEFGYQGSEAALDAAKLALVENVKSAFYALVLSEELTRLNKAIMENTKDHFTAAKARYGAGQASQSELISIESGLSDVWQAYDASLSQRDALQAVLGNLLNLAADARIIPASGFAYEEKELVYDEAFLEAMKKRPEIRQYESGLQASRSSVEAAKAGSRPTVYASWDYYTRSHALASTSRGWNDYNVIGITVSWPVFDGWLTRAKVEQAVIGLKQAQLNKEKALQAVALDVKTAYLGLKDAIARLRSVQDSLRVSEDTSRAMQEKFDSGIASSLDREDAQLAYSVAKFSQTQALYDYMVAKAGFERARGGTL
jgi:outer membrane protein TolC